MRFWISVSVLCFVLNCFAFSAPTTKDDNSKVSVNASTKPSTKTEEKTVKAETQKKEDNEFKVPSSKLDNGQLLKAASMTGENFSTDGGFLETETKKLLSDKEKKTEAKLLRMVFDGKDKKISAKDQSDEKPKTKRDKKGKKQKQKHASKSQFVFKVEEVGKPEHKKLKKHHRKHRAHHDKKDRKSGYMKWKRPTYYDDDDDLEEYYDGHRISHSYGPERKYQGRYSKNVYRRIPYRHHYDYDDEEEQEDRKQHHGRPHEYRVTKSFKPNVSPSDFGFDQKHMESVFGNSFRPGGFGSESMAHIGHSGKMLSHSFQYDDY